MNLGEVHIKTVILLATFGLANSISDEVARSSKEAENVKYHRNSNKGQLINSSSATLKDKQNQLKDESREGLSETVATTTYISPVSSSSHQGKKFLYSYMIPATNRQKTIDLLPQLLQLKIIKQEEREKVKETESAPESENEEKNVAHEKEDAEEEDLDEKGDLENEKEETKDEDEEEDDEDQDDYQEIAGESQENAHETDEEDYEEDDDKEALEDDPRKSDVMERRTYDEDVEDEHYENEELDDTEADEREELEEEEEDSPPKRKHNQSAVTPPPLSWNQIQGPSPVPLMKQAHEPTKRPEYTTLFPYTELRPISYSTMVISPDLNPVTELSGSFYKKPLKAEPYSDVFPKAQESASESISTAFVTVPGQTTEESKLPPERTYIEAEEEDETMYVEPESVTSNVHYTVQDLVFPHKTILNLNPIKPIGRFGKERVGWFLKREKESKAEPEALEESSSFEETTREIETQQGSSAEKDSPRSVNENLRQLFRKPNKDLHYQEEEDTQEGRPEGEDVTEEVSEDEEENGRVLSRASKEQWMRLPVRRDRNELYEYVYTDDDVQRQTESENTEKLKGVGSETAKSGVYTDDDAGDPKLKKEYFVTPYQFETTTTIENEGRNKPHFSSLTDEEPKENVKEEEKPRAEAKPDEVDTTEKSRKNSDEIHFSRTTPQIPTEKAKPYSFGTISNPNSYEYYHFKNADKDSDLYNQIVTNIQSLFTSPSQNSPQLQEHSHPRSCNKHAEHDTFKYENFIKPTEHSTSESEEEDDVNNPMPAGKKLSVKMYVVQDKITTGKKVPPKIPKKNYKKLSGGYPGNMVLVGKSSNNPVRKVIYYNEVPKKVVRYSPSSQILKIVRPRSDRRDVPLYSSPTMLIIRKLSR